MGGHLGDYAAFIRRGLARSHVADEVPVGDGVLRGVVLAPRCPGAPPNASQLALDHMPAGRATGHLGGVSGQAAIWAASMP